MTVRPVITIRQVDPAGRSLQVLLGDGTPAPSADGGWEVVSRPKRTGFVNWTGQNPITMDVAVILDGHRTDRSIEVELAMLENMVRRPQGTRGEPPVVSLAGPVPHTNLRWVINNLTYGETFRRTHDGARTRQVLTLTFLEYVSPAVVVQRPHPAVRARARAASAPAPSRIYVVRRGDTLSKIAATQLHNVNRWREIAKINSIRDPNNIKVGQRLRLP